MRYPISVQSFETIIDRNLAYVDKTSLVYELAQEHVCFLSRPRRFGKSLLISTLDAYFSGKKELFHGLKIENLENNWKEHPILRIDFAVGDYTQANTLNEVLDDKLSKWEAEYEVNNIREDLGLRFLNIIEAVHKKTGNNVVVLIDEYDKPMLDAIGTELEETNRNILKGFYSTFKAADSHLRFVLLTGVTKFSQISVFSGFNQPKDISMDSKYDALCGITEMELYQYFAEPIERMADNRNCSVDEIKTMLKKQYDGYHFSEKMTDIYNPFSVINAFDMDRIDNYWYRSGTPTYLVKLLEGRNINIQELIEKSYSSDYFVDYRADVENPLAMLYQSGYLTIKNFDERHRLYKLDFPNDEVRLGFVTLISNNYFKKTSSDSLNWIIGIDDMLRECNLDGVRDAFTSFLASIPYEANKDERAKDFETHFSYTFYIINRLLGCYTTLIEKQNSKGRADVIIESVNDIFIFEFKLDGSAEEALAQIEEKQYALPYLSDVRKLHKIGVNISSETRTVDEWIAR